MVQYSYKLTLLAKISGIILGIIGIFLIGVNLTDHSTIFRIDCIHACTVNYIGSET